MSYTVSIITPTTHERKDLLALLKKDIENQTFQNIEWIVLNGSESIGEKRNKGCEQAKGDVIVHFDDDDHYEPTYIADALTFLMKNNVDITGLKNIFYIDMFNPRAWLYEYKGLQPYVVGSGMMYKREVFEKKRYLHISEGEDTRFLENAGKVRAFDGTNLFYARIHNCNTASQKVLSLCKEYDYNKLKKHFNL